MLQALLILLRFYPRPARVAGGYNSLRIAALSQRGFHEDQPLYDKS